MKRRRFLLNVLAAGVLAAVPLGMARLAPRFTVRSGSQLTVEMIRRAMDQLTVVEPFEGNYYAYMPLSEPGPDGKVPGELRGKLVSL